MYAAAGTGVCLRPSTAWTYEVVVLDGSCAHGRRSRCRGCRTGPGCPRRAAPSRGRVRRRRLLHRQWLLHPDGILDTRTGGGVGSLEDFTVIRDGAPYRSVDVNYWGVTFAADDNRFYATMSTAGAPVPRPRRPRGPHRRDPEGERRVPVTVAGRHPDRVQEGDRRGPERRAGGCRSSTWRAAGHRRPPSRPQRRRPGGVAGRRDAGLHAAPGRRPARRLVGPGGRLGAPGAGSGANRRPRS